MSADNLPRVDWDAVCTCGHTFAQHRTPGSECIECMGGEGDGCSWPLTGAECRAELYEAYRTRSEITREHDELQRRPGSMTPAHERRRSPFSAGWGSTMILLSRELDHLDAERAVLELAITEGDLRRDGLPRASARPAHPGVVLSFDSRHGALRYSVDRFDRWQDNLRAIALALESLRRVQRYGLGQAGEQYRGWRAIEAGGGSLVERGRELIAQHGSVTAALHATHPDRGGVREDLEAVLAAREAGA